MKFLSEIKNAAVKMFVLAAVASPMLVSCYDDSKLQEQIDMLVDKVFALEEQMNAEISALKGLLEGKLLITDVVRDGGTTNVVLSDSTVLKLLPQKDLKSFVSYITLSDGTKCWAYIDENGQKQLFLDEQNHPIPVMTETPEVIVKDDETWIVIGGKEYPLSGNSVFSDYEVIEDEETGEVLAVTFVFGETMTFTVTVNSAQGFWFVKDSTDEAEEMVKFDSYFVPVGQTVKVQVKSKGVEDYVVQLPEGWKYKEVKDKVAGKDYFEISAPSAEAMAAGAATEGNLKVLAVLTGGKASAARLYLSTDPFKTLNVSYGKLTVERYPGIEGYICGVASADSYDKGAILDGVKALKDNEAFPAGYKLAEDDIVAVNVEELLGVSLVVSSEYVVWAVPVTVSEHAYVPVESAFAQTRFKYATVDLEVTKEDFLDVTVKLQLAGVPAYYFGIETADAFDAEVVLAGLNAGDKYTALTAPMTYEGSAFELAAMTANHSTDYLMWLAVAKDGSEYVADDVILVPFKTSTFAPGGTTVVKVNETQVKTAPTWVSAPIAAEGASMLFYTYLKATDKKLSGTDEDMVAYLLKSGVQVEGSSAVTASNDEEVALKLNDETDVVLVALAVDANGKYGSILKYDLKTSALTYSNVDVKIDLLKQDPGDVILKVTATGDDVADYIYWIGPASNNFWLSSNHLGGTVESASKYMALNPDNYRLTDTKKAYPIASDGTISCKDLDAGGNYRIVCAAVDKNGLTSMVETLAFTVYTRKIGNVVESTDSKWEAARPTVEWIEEKFLASTGQTFGSFAFNVTIPSGFTGYVLAGTDSYFNGGDDDAVIDPIQKMVDIMDNADHRRDSDRLVDVDAWLYEYYHFEHGDPLAGNVIIWANEEFHNSYCNPNDSEDHCGGNFSTTGIRNLKEVEVMHVIHINDGTPVEVRQPYAVGSKKETIDKVFVVCQDLSGNCYEPFEFPVPVELFVNAGERDE